MLFLQDYTLLDQAKFFDSDQDAREEFAKLKSNNPKDTIFLLGTEKINGVQKLKCLDVHTQFSTKNSLKESEFELVCDNKVIIVADEPGMGKSTSLTKLTDSKILSTWIIRIPLKNCTQFLNKLPETGLPSAKEVVDFLWAAVGDSNDNILAKRLLGNYFENGESNSGRPMLVLLDGYDELQEEVHRNKIVSLLKFFNISPSPQILITTRRHLKLEEELKALTVAEFVPLEKDQQIQFLKESWKVNCHLLLSRKKHKTIFDGNDNKFENFSHALLNKTNEKLGKTISRFFGVPLQMRLLAETFLTEFINYICNNGVFEIDKLELLNLFNLYERFIDAKFTLYFKEKTVLSCGFNYVTQQWMRNVV